MLTPDLKDVTIDVFGGYVPAVAPQNLPPGASPFCQDSIYPLNAVKQRGGLLNQNYVGTVPASFNGLKSYLTPTLAKRLMAWDSLGNLYKESPQGILNLIGSRAFSNLFFQAVTIFGRQYEVFFNATTGGFDQPRQYDDTNWDRVTMSGPGQAPTASDEATANLIIAASPNGAIQLPGFNIMSLSSNGFLCTMLFTFSFGGGPVAGFTPKVGDRFQISGASIGGYNGTWAVASSSGVGSPNLSIQFINTVSGLATDSNSGAVVWAYALLTFTSNMTGVANIGTGNSVVVSGVTNAAYDGTFNVPFSTFTAGLANPLQVVININAFGTAASGAGTASIAGNITAGTRQVTVCWITRQGWISAPAVAPNSWLAGGSKRVTLNNIATFTDLSNTNPTGRVIARLLLFTPVITPPATTGTFYSLPNGSTQIATSTMLINDNTTTSVTLDFNDTILQSGFQAEYLFTQVNLGQPSFIGGYNNRLLTLSDRNRLANLVNLDFEGGFDNATLVPNGWTFTGTRSALGSSGNSDYAASLQIIGDGATPTRVTLSQTAYLDWLKVPIISSNTAYSIRFRVQRSPVMTSGAINVGIKSVLAGINSNVTVAFNTPTLTSTGFVEFSGQVLTANQILGSVPTDLVLQIFDSGTITNNAFFIIDSIEVFPTNTPYNYSTARFSHSFNPESFDSVTSSVQVRPNDGQRLQAGFPVRGNYYLGKDSYLAYVTDDGVNEPASWGGGVVEVSPDIGICGPNAVDWTQEWAAFAHRSGVYLVWGSDPVKISQEIQYDASFSNKPSWSSINWNAAATIWVRIDQVNKLILVGAPINGATSPNIIFVLDYQWQDSAQDIASSPMVTYSAFTGKSLAHGRGRRWAIWNIAANSMTFAERADGTAQPFYGNATGNGKIYQMLPAETQSNDDGVFINFRYDNYWAPSGDLEQALQLGGHRKLLGYAKWLARGVGGFVVTVNSPARATVLRTYILSLSPPGDAGRPVSIHGERFSLSFTTAPVVATGAFAWVQVEKTLLCMKRDPTIVVRGTNQ